MDGFLLLGVVLIPEVFALGHFIPGSLITSAGGAGDSMQGVSYGPQVH